MIVKSCDVGPGREGRMDRVVQEMTGLPRSGVCGLFDHGCVTVNGAPASAAGAPARAGDVVEVRYDPHRRYHARSRPPGESPFRIVFEDAHLLVVNKRPGVLTVPTERGETDTLVQALDEYLARSGGRAAFLGGGRPSRRAAPGSRGKRAPEFAVGGPGEAEAGRPLTGSGPRPHGRGARVGVVQRLDRDASGLLVFAKTPDVTEKLREQFEHRKPEREYAALVAGVPEPGEGTFRSRLTTDPGLQRRSVPRGEWGEIAITHYRVERRLDGAALVRVRLETGRRNQIRVQFAEAGHPVLGDRRYAPDLATHPHWTSRRLALHAAVLGFAHPVTGKRMRFELPLPGAFGAFLSPAASRERKKRPGGRR